jgi:3,4-dihydroxyphenylacetate 2,3-dioxygenase
VHWQVNSEYHINCGPRFKGIYTSNELPHFIKNMPYDYPGNPALGHLIADVANEMDVTSRAHSDTTLDLEYGTLVPMRYMNSDQHYKVICVSGWCDWHDLKESERFGLAVRRAIEERYEGAVAVFASGSLSHHFADNGKAPEYAFKTYNAFLEQIDLRVVELWERGEHATVIDMLPMYAEKCWGEGDMHDTAMLYGLLGGAAYKEKVEVVTPYFGSSGTGQINAIFPVVPLAKEA